ncbi:MAG TPA: DEAD/DEAH box helicase [Candidatus Nanoarchaeia archaeon]|nr:DEAD/DEAH box helicase [Candidatus Nanoarchaeia archaeon]
MIKSALDLTSLGLPSFFNDHYKQYPGLSPVQLKAVEAGLLEGKSMLVCAPTGSGKTLVATIALVKALTNSNQLNSNNNSISNNNNGTGKTNNLDNTDYINSNSKAIYLVPLKALANEKFTEFQKLFSNTGLKVVISTGEVDSDSSYLNNYDLLILTTEKLDSLLRHNCPWLNKVKVVVVDEIHLLNDPSRGPTLEIIITLLKSLIKPQLIGLSATIGNQEELAQWLEAELVADSWRPVELKKGINLKGEVEFYP